MNILFIRVFLSQTTNTYYLTSIVLILTREGAAYLYFVSYRSFNIKLIDLSKKYSVTIAVLRKEKTYKHKTI